MKTKNSQINNNVKEVINLNSVDTFWRKSQIKFPSKTQFSFLKLHNCIAYSVVRSSENESFAICLIIVVGTPCVKLPNVIHTVQWYHHT